MAKVTMADVAREAEVNKATVSRALKGDPRISSSTREKVWDAAKKLGYRMDAVARGLSSNTTGVIGVVMKDLNTDWAGTFLSGVERVLSRYRIELMLKEANGVDTSCSSVFDNLLARKVDGVIWFVPESVPVVKDPMPFIVRVGWAGKAGYPSVLIDEDGLFRKLKKYLNGRSFQYRAGKDPFYPFLSRLSVTEKVVGKDCLILDNCLPVKEDISKADILCGMSSLSSVLNLTCLDWPAFEMGGLAARILVNMIKSRGVRPNEVHVSPVLCRSDVEYL